MTKNSETHNVCNERLAREGGKATCCDCDPHEGCTLSDHLPEASKTIDKPFNDLPEKDQKEIIRGAMKHAKRKQDEILDSKKQISNEVDVATGGKDIRIEDMNQLKQPIDDLSEAMVKNIANELIKVDSAAEGRGAQRHWYLVAQKMLKKLVKEYERVCKEEYQ